MAGQRRRLAGLLVTLAVIVTACGGDDGDTETETEADGGSGDELTPIDVSIIPVADLAPFFYGVDQGYFEEEGLDVNLEVAGAGSPVDAVVTGEYELAIGNYVTLMNARNAGVEVQVVTHSVSGHDAPEGGSQGLLVAPDSGIDSIDDLAGRTFGVTRLHNIGEVTVRAMLDNHGVDHSDVEFREVQVPEMNTAVRGDEIDVVWQAEPFLTLGEAEGLVLVADPMYETEPSLPLAGMFAAQDWLEDNPELAAGFYRAWQRSHEAATDEEAMRDAIVEHTETEADLAAEMRLGNWEPELDLDKLALLGELAATYDVIEAEPNLDELVWTPPE